MLQADSKEMFDAWITALQKGIGAAFHRINSSELTDNAKTGSCNNGLTNSSVTNVNNNKIKKIR